MASLSTWILSVKALLISTGVISMAVVMKGSVPMIVNFAVYQVPAIWSTLLSWLRPPYLYFIVNGIIVTIAVSSRFYHKHEDDSQSEPLVPAKVSPPSDLPSDFPPVSNQPALGVLESPAPYGSEPRVLDLKPVMINGSEVVVHEDEDESVISRSTSAPPQRINSLENQTDYLFPVTEKPLVSSRFGHWKPVKASPEGGRALRVAKPKNQETLESTWKTITDRRHMPLTRHLRKSDTWENHDRQIHVSPQDSSSPHVVYKSERFKDRTSYSPPPVSSVSSSPGSGKIRKEASPSQEELNRRVEAFIKKFNDEMRLQRQESMNQYLEMINRGAH